MKYPARLFWCALILVLSCLKNQAQILDINQFKTTVYKQANQGPPTSPDYPDSYFFGTYIDADPDFGYNLTNVTVYPPDFGNLVLNQRTPTYFQNGSPYFSDFNLFNAAYPGGPYDYYFEYTNGTFSDPQSGDIYFEISTTNLFSPVIPAFTPNCWNAMQHVNPNVDFDMVWNSYSVVPGADLAYTFIGVSDNSSGNFVIVPNGPPSLTSTNIPAGTLLYGRTYSVNLYFSERQLPDSFGVGGVRVVVGWDNLTQTTLTTIQPPLQIAAAGSNVVLTWPTLATNNYQLQYATNLSPVIAWSNVTNAPSISGGTNFLTLPVIQGSTRFFRLNNVSP